MSPHWTATSPATPPSETTEIPPAGTQSPKPRVSSRPHRGLFSTTRQLLVWMEFFSESMKFRGERGSVCAAGRQTDAPVCTQTHVHTPRPMCLVTCTPGTLGDFRGPADSSTQDQPLCQGSGHSLLLLCQLAAQLLPGERQMGCELTAEFGFMSATSGREPGDCSALERVAFKELWVLRCTRGKEQNASGPGGARLLAQALGSWGTTAERLRPAWATEQDCVSDKHLG